MEVILKFRYKLMVEKETMETLTVTKIDFMGKRKK